MIIDLHAHTWYSSCGKDQPETLIKTMIEKGVEYFGITDHRHGIGDKKEQYCKEIKSLSEKYADKIKIFCGTEINSLPEYFIKDDDLSVFDFVLVEYLAYSDDSVLKGDLVSFAKKQATRTGIAHTDLFGFIKKMGWDAKEVLSSYADNGIFWEMNVSYDSIHHYKEHEYVLEFMKNEEQQKIVRESKMEISVGFDGHRLEDYAVDRVKRACDFLKERDIKIFVPKFKAKEF